jgi:glucose-1-phosphate thymidylyltransferase
VKVIIPAAGRGTRLFPAALTMPKTLVYVAGKPILGHILDNLKEIKGDNKIDSIGFITGTGESGDRILEYANINYKHRFSFDHVVQGEPKGLGDAIYLYLKEKCHNDDTPILIILSDTIVDADLDNMLKSECNSIAVKKVDDPTQFGIVEVKNDGIYAEKLWEKPKTPPSNLAIVGIYFIRDVQLLFECLKEIIEGDSNKNTGKNPEVKEYQLTDALEKMLEKGKNITTYNVDAWLDCGSPKSLIQTNRYLLKKFAQNYTIPEGCIGNTIIPPVSIDSSAKIENSIIGPYVSIAGGVEIKNSIIEDTIINEEAKITRSMIKESLIGYKAILNGQTGRLTIGDYSEVASAIFADDK